MFSFLKEKIKSAISRISKKIEEEFPEREIEAEREKETKIKKAEEKKAEAPKEAKKERVSEEKVVEEKTEIAEEEAKEIKPKEEIGEKEKKGLFKKLTEKITTKKISSDQFDTLFWDLELSLLENNVAVEVIEKIKLDLKEKLVDKPIKRSEVEGKIVESLKHTIEEVLMEPKFDLVKEIKAKKEKPYVICFVGINGGGKTTTVAKIAHLLQKNNLSCVLAAADTFRAASIEQLGEWAKRLNIKLIAHEYKSDAAAVCYDAIQHAKARYIDSVLIDTAGRLHSNKDLVEEMKKIIKVAKPDLKIFVGEALTGNDCIIQAQQFDSAINIDGIILTKADVDEKGGAAISSSFVTKKPVLYLGTGQQLDDIEKFSSEKIINSFKL